MTTSTLQHDVLPYSGPGGFVQAAVVVASDALAHDAVPVVLAGALEIAAVRSALGRRGTSVVGLDMGVTGRNPARILPALQHFVDAYPGHALVCIGEPIRPGHRSAIVREVELHELMLRLPAFHSWNCRLMCAYDTAALKPELVETIEASHSPASTDPEDMIDRARAVALPARPVTSAELGVDRTTLSVLRGFIQGRGHAAGLDDERVDDLVYAVNEVVTNSICHGEGRARISFWTEPGSVVCEVRDRGWIRDPLAGRIAPRPDRTSGRGLWLVNQLCDLVQLRSSPAGTTVRLYIDT